LILKQIITNPNGNINNQLQQNQQQQQQQAQQQRHLPTTQQYQNY
jgi:hypothetical protein